MENKIIKNETLPSNLIELAIKNNAGLEQLEKLMDLQERWEKKEAKKLFFNSMAQFMKIKPDIKKDSKADYTTKAGFKIKYEYSTLKNIQKLIDPLLSELSLSYSFKTKIENDKLQVSCIVYHESGHSEEYTLEAPSDLSGNKSLIHGMGSTNTYLQRYTLCNAFGLSAENDDDGKGNQSKPPKPLTEDEINNLYIKITDINNIKNLHKLYNSDARYKVDKDIVQAFKDKNKELL